MKSSIVGNVIGLGEGGLVGCSILAECFCPLLPNPCYLLVRLIQDKLDTKNETKILNKKAWEILT
jgi:hypothetical protein